MLSAGVRFGLGVRTVATLVLLTSAAWGAGQSADTVAHSKDDSVEVRPDGGGQEMLESMFIPPMANAPFSLTFATEWSRPLNNGGSYTIAIVRPIKRDSAGRIYQEISTTEPDPNFFVPPEGWPVVDRRKSAMRPQ
jgi:hypothetical protein